MNNSKKSTGLYDQVGNEMFVGDTITVLLRNNYSFNAKIEEEDGLFIVKTDSHVLGRLVIRECYIERYKELANNLCKHRYAIFYKCNN